MQLLDSFQSAYRPVHSTETALVRVQNDILKAVDDGQVVILLLFDLSAAFDMVKHDILLQRLSDRFWNLWSGALVDRILPIV